MSSRNLSRDAGGSMAKFNLTGELLSIHIHEAQDLAIADSNGFSDPYAVIRHAGQKKKTKTIKKNLNPRWHEAFSIQKGEGEIIIEVMDWDFGSADDYLGEIRIPTQPTGEPRWFPLVLGPGKKPPNEHGSAGVQGRILVDVQSGAAPSGQLTSTKIGQIKDRVAATQQAGSKSLDLSGSSLSTIPGILSEEMSYLTSIDASFNNFRDFPNFSGFSGLEILNLSGNQISVVPPAVGTLRSVVELWLNGNALINVPKEIGQLVNLEKLNLSNNQLTEIPWEIGHLTRMTDFSFSGNDLSKTGIPKSIGNCVSMEVLDLSCCKIRTAIPEEFTLMTKLMELVISSNEITELPEGFGRLTRLVVLDLNTNKLSDLPIGLGNCGGLGKIGHGINIAANPIKDDDMLAKYRIGNDHLLDYLEKRLAQAGNPPPPRAPRAPRMDGGVEPASPAAAAPAAQQQRPAQIDTSSVQQLDQKTTVLKNWALQTVAEIRTYVANMKNNVNASVGLEQAMPFAHKIREIKKQLDGAAAHLPPTPLPAKPAPTADKLQALKAVTLVAISEVEQLLVQIQRSLNLDNDAQKVLAFVVILKGTKPLL